MNTVFILTILAAGALGAARVFMKFVSSSFHPLFAISLIYILLGCAGLIIFLFSPARIHAAIQWPAILFIILAVASFIAFDIATLFIFSSGGEVALFTPVTAGISILIAFVIGLFVFGEKIILLQIIGMVFTIAGILMLLRR